MRLSGAFRSGSLVWGRLPVTTRRLSGGALVGGALLLTACGARTRPWPGDEEAFLRSGGCYVDADCPVEDLCAIRECVDHECVDAGVVACEPTRACVVSACEPSSGECVEMPATHDLDGDGFVGPLPGYEAGEEGSCGNDCDDTSALAHPGGAEVCDGVDNDCDGVVDNGELYLDAVVAEANLVQVSSDQLESSAARSIAYGDGAYAIGYGGRNDELLSYLRGIASDGTEVFPETVASNVHAASFGVDLAWSGASFGAVWSDARLDDNYEIYFSLFDAWGGKLAEDIRLTVADDFSIHPSVIYDQGRFLLVYDDHRNADSSGVNIYGRLVSPTGEPMGSEVLLASDGDAAEAPAVAATVKRVGLAYTVLDGLDVGVSFRSFDKQLLNGGSTVAVAPRAALSPSITALGDRFLITWDVYDEGPGSTIQGALLDEDGKILVGPSDLTQGATYARSHSTVSLGDRVLLVWGDDLDGNYEIYAKVLDDSLVEIEPRTRLTDEPAESLMPDVVLGDAGRVGVVFDDWRGGARATYFTTLGCQSALP